MKKTFSLSWFHLAYAVVTILLVIFLVIPIAQLFINSFGMLFNSEKPLPTGFLHILCMLL